MAVVSGNLYKVYYIQNGVTAWVLVNAATPQAAVTAAVADQGVVAANVIEVQSVDPQPVTINS